MRGGRINTDFIDNSAGVDTSDHEVNIKILLDRVVQAGDLTEKQRNKLLAEMTDEVGTLVLRDNYEQNLALANAGAFARGLLHVHEDWMKQLERDGVLNRELEGLPTSREVRRRLESGEALTAPELSVLLAWTKILLAEELLDSDLPDDPYLAGDLRSYFPTPMRQGFEEQIGAHPLRREIIVTQVVNDLVNGAGMTFWPRLAGETGASPAELTRANFVAREIFGSLPLRQELTTYDNVLDAAVQTRMRVEMRTLVERASRWLVTNRRPPLDSQATVDYFSGSVQRVMGELPDLMTGRELDGLPGAARRAGRQGGPRGPRHAGGGVAAGVHAARDHRDRQRRGRSTPRRSRGSTSPSGSGSGCRHWSAGSWRCRAQDRWQTMARAALRDDLHSVHAQLTRKVLLATSADDSDPGTRRGLGGRRHRAGLPGGRHAGGDLRRRRGRPGPGVGGAAGGARAARHGVSAEAACRVDDRRVGAH